MDGIQTVAHRIDRHDRLGVDAGWTAFAAVNGGEALLPSHVVGGLIWGQMLCTAHNLPRPPAARA